MKVLEARQAYRMQERIRLLQAQRESGLTIRAWCAENRIKESSYYYWLQETRKAALLTGAGEKPEMEQALVRIGLPDRINSAFENMTVPAIRMQYQGAALEIPPGIEPKDLTAVLKALDQK